MLLAEPAPAADLAAEPQVVEATVIARPASGLDAAALDAAAGLTPARPPSGPPARRLRRR